jgi:dUTP pyrophosphatase
MAADQDFDTLLSDPFPLTPSAELELDALAQQWVDALRAVTAATPVLDVRVKRVHPDAILPKYATPGAACFDLHAVEDGEVPGLRPIQTMNGTQYVPFGGVKFDTGLAFEIPEGYVLKIYSRSGHGFKSNVRLSNGTGIGDSDYRGTVSVSLVADSGTVAGTSGVFKVKKGDRIAQAMIEAYPRVRLTETAEDLSETERGTGGFGSTGA